MSSLAAMSPRSRCTRGCCRRCDRARRGGRAFLEPLTRRLLQTPAARRDTQLGEQAAIDAILDYVQHPHRFRPEKASIENYLFMSAGGDLRNALRRERRHTSRAVSLDGAPADVELALSERNSSSRGPSVG